MQKRDGQQKTEQKNIPWEQEVEMTLKRMKDQCCGLPEMEYFFTLARTYFAKQAVENGRPSVIAVGPSVPEAMIRASGASLRFLLGGSPQACTLAGDAVPRDIDPVSRSILGMLESELAMRSDRPFILIPVTGDSSRKLAYELKRRGVRVHVMDIPPLKEPWAEEKWLRQWERLREALQSYTGRWIRDSHVRKQERKLEICRIQARRFEEVAVLTNILPAVCRMFVLESYYFSEEPEIWADRVFSLTAKLKEAQGKRGMREMKERAVGRKGTVFLMGSPVYFPNYKLPFLLEDTGLELSGFFNASVSRLLFPSRPSLSKNGAIRFLWEDCSEAYVGNSDFADRVFRMIRTRRPGGLFIRFSKDRLVTIFS